MNMERNVKRIEIVTLLLLLPCLVFSQALVKGTVTDSKGPIAFANVVLTNKKDSTLFGAVTNDDGSFSIQASKGKYLLMVTFIGYEDWQSEIDLESNLTLDNIILTPLATQLNEVIFIAEKSLVERKVDRIVFNVESSVAAAGGNVMEALRIMPGVRIENDQISLIGKSGVRVMVNERIVQLTGEDLQAFLSSMSANDIKKIEVITNPPAKYQANGQSGLINIVTKTVTHDSWNNNVSSTYTQGRVPIINLRNTLGYKKDKVRMLASVNAEQQDMRWHNNMTNEFNEGQWTTNQIGNRRRKIFFGRYEIDFNLTKQTTIGFQYYGHFIDARKTMTGNSFAQQESEDFALSSHSLSLFNSNNNAFNTHFISSLDSRGRKLSIDVDYLRYDNLQDHHFTADRTTETGTIEKDLLAQNIADLHVANYSANADVIHPIGKFNLSYGARIGIIDNKSATRYYDDITGTRETPPELNDNFRYLERIEALYANGSISINNKIEVKAGLRVEDTHTVTESDQLGENKRHYANLFPTFYITNNVNKNHTFSFTYGKRINRPSFLVLSPYRFNTNSYFSDEGNPFLRPALSHNLEFSHAYKSSLISNIFVTYQTNGYDFVLKSNEETNETVLLIDNFFNQCTYGFSESYSTALNNWWEASLDFYGYYVYATFFRYKPVNSNLDKVSYNIKSTNTFTLNKTNGLKALVSFWYNSPFVEGILNVSSSYSVDVSLKWTTLQNKLNVSAGFFDIFNSANTVRYSTINGINQRQHYYGVTQYFRMSLSYSFGNNKIGLRERKFGNEDERRRL